jgi:hypothetical protein
MRREEALIEPPCQASILRYTKRLTHAKNRLLFSNPAGYKERVRMTVRLSYDEGMTWPVSRELHSGPSAYSCLTVLPDMTIGCLYERGDNHAYEKITFACFTLEWLTNGADHLTESGDHGQKCYFGIAATEGGSIRLRKFEEITPSSSQFPTRKTVSPGEAGNPGR